MQRAATDVMQSIIFSAVLDGIAALKRSSGGLPNQLLRDVQAIHATSTFDDLPKALSGRNRPEHARRVHQLLKKAMRVGPASRCSNRARSTGSPRRQREPPLATAADPSRGPAHGAGRLRPGGWRSRREAQEGGGSRSARRSAADGLMPAKRRQRRYRT